MKDSVDYIKEHIEEVDDQRQDPDSAPPLASPDFATVLEGFRMVLRGLGVDLTDPHFKNTPYRVARAWYGELCRGLTTEAPEATTFPVEGDQGMVILKAIPIRSLCAHHLLPYFGTASIGYITGNEQILGLSKLSRIADWQARRPSVQESLTQSIATSIYDKIRCDGSKRGGKPRGGVGVVIRASHMCMALRGVNHTGEMVTSAIRGQFEFHEVRAEFLKLIGES